MSDGTSCMTNETSQSLSLLLTWVSGHKSSEENFVHLRKENSINVSFIRKIHRRRR